MSKRARSKAANAGNKPSNPSLQPLRYSVREAAGMLRISVAQTWKRVWSGELRHVRDGARVLIPHEEVCRYAARSHES
jgi:excisionase family DNA binding protein